MPQLLCLCLDALRPEHLAGLCGHSDVVISIHQQPVFVFAAPGAWDFAIPHITPGNWDSSHMQQQAGQDHNKGDGSGPANGGVQFHNQGHQPSTQLQQACPIPSCMCPSLQH